jgi:peptide/nickel transport system substrate-binding protein
MRRHILVLCLAASACKCPSQPSQQTAAPASSCQPRPDGSVTVAISAPLLTLDWSRSHEAAFQNYPVLLAMMHGLTKLGPDFQPQPQLADSWDVALTGDSPPKQVYTFHLKKGVVWSDGKTPLRAQDFVFAWRRAVIGADAAEMVDLDGAEAALAASKAGTGVDEVLQKLGVEAVDDATLKVTLKGPRSYFLSRVAYVYPYFPAPSADLEGKTEDEIHRYFDEPQPGKPLVLGAFQLGNWDRVAQKVELIANPSDAWKPASGAVKKLILITAELSPLMYDQCRVDFLYLDDASALSHPPSDMQTSRLLSVYWLGFNTTKVPLPLRHAITNAIDRPALMKALSGMIPAPRAARGFLPPEMPGALAENDARLDTLPAFDLEKSKADLKEAGYNGEELTLLVRSNGSFMPEMALAQGIRRQLEAAGVKVTLVSTANLTNDIKDGDGTLRHHLFLKRTGADYAHPHTLLTVFLRNGNHYTDWQKLDGGGQVDKFEALLAKGAGESDAKAMTETYAQAQQLLQSDEAVALPIYYPNRYYRRRPWIEGLSIDAFNFLTFADLRLKAP